MVDNRNIIRRFDHVLVLRHLKTKLMVDTRI